MKYVIIAGSHRSQSQSSKVAHYITGQLKQLAKTTEVSIIDLKDNPLPLWHDCMRNKEPVDQYQARKQARDPIAEQLIKADAVVIIAPERGGMVPAGLKNFFLYAGAEYLGNKPGLLVGVSSGIGGTYPIAELRMSSYKNTQLCYIPQHIIIRSVNDMLNDTSRNQEKNHRDVAIKERIDYSLSMLEQYGLALQQVRESGIADFEKYPYGM